jgi:hypothetical protein
MVASVTIPGNNEMQSMLPKRLGKVGDQVMASTQSSRFFAYSIHENQHNTWNDPLAIDRTKNQTNNHPAPRKYASNPDPQNLHSGPINPHSNNRPHPNTQTKRIPRPNLPLQPPARRHPARQRNAPERARQKRKRAPTFHPGLRLCRNDRGTPFITTIPIVLLLQPAKNRHPSFRRLNRRLRRIHLSPPNPPPPHPHRSKQPHSLRHKRPSRLLRRRSPRSENAAGRHRPRQRRKRRSRERMLHGGESPRSPSHSSRR